MELFENTKKKLMFLSCLICMQYLTHFVGCNSKKIIKETKKKAITNHKVLNVNPKIKREFDLYEMTCDQA